MENSLTIFQGTSFAAPPIGALRWKAPQTVKKWDGVKQAFHLYWMAMKPRVRYFTTGGQGHPSTIEFDRNPVGEKKVNIMVIRHD